MTPLENVITLMDTLHVFESYSTPSEEPIVEAMGPAEELSYEEYMCEKMKCMVLLPEDIEKMKNIPQNDVQSENVSCKIDCVDNDTFSEACCVYNENAVFEEDDWYRLTLSDEEVMVLNFANPYIPGGGVRKGANAQEEDLCRRSSLLLSLESEEAKKYYQYNIENKKRDLFGNDYGNTAMILSPTVSVIKDKKGKRLEQSFPVGVLTVAAPIILNKSYVSEEYLDTFYERIQSILLCAAHYGYKHLILGAWGCGAFGNEPETVANLFRDAIEHFSYAGKDVHKLFKSITFAVPYNEKRPANYLAFVEKFGRSDW